MYLCAATFLLLKPKATVIDTWHFLTLFQLAKEGQAQSVMIAVYNASGKYEKL